MSKPIFKIPVEIIKAEMNNNPEFLKKKDLEISSRIYINEKDKFKSKILINKLLLIFILLLILEMV